MPNSCLEWPGEFYHRVLSCRYVWIVRQSQTRSPLCVVVRPSDLSHDMGFANLLCGGGILISFLWVGCGRRSLGGSTVGKVIRPRLGCCAFPDRRRVVTRLLVLRFRRVLCFVMFGRRLRSVGFGGRRFRREGD